MDTDDLPEQIKEEKKRAFVEKVQICAQVLGGPTPRVNFIEVPCSDSISCGDVELAHIHIEAHYICVWERQLHKMSMDDVKETATHEVAHLMALGDDHGPAFQKALNALRADTWESPNPGVLTIHGNDLATRPVDSEESKRIEEGMKSIEWAILDKENKKWRDYNKALDRASGREADLRAVSRKITGRKLCPYCDSPTPHDGTCPSEYDAFLEKTTLKPSEPEKFYPSQPPIPAPPTPISRPPKPPPPPPSTKQQAAQPSTDAATVRQRWNFVERLRRRLKGRGAKVHGTVERPTDDFEAIRRRAIKDAEAQFKKIRRRER